MPVKSPNVRATAVAITLAAETTAISGIPAVAGSSAASDGQTICGVINFTAGTAATAVTVRCKTAVPNQVGTSQVHTIAAGASANIPFCFADQTGDTTTTYSISLQQTAATGNGTVNEIVAYTLGEG